METADEFDIPETILEQLSDPVWVKHQLATGKFPEQMLGFSEETMSKFYTTACEIYEEKAYEDAEKAFLFLTTLNPYHYDYWLGLGAAKQGIGKYETAIDAYEIAAICQLDNPLPYFHLAKCLFAIHDRSSALQAIELAIEYAKENDDYTDLYERALKAKELLIQEQ